MTSAELTRYDSPLIAFWNELLEGWIDYVSRNNILLMNISDALFDAYCETFCHNMKNYMHNYWEHLPKTIRRNKQQ